MILKLFSFFLCAGSLGLGVMTSSMSAKNRMRENQLDYLQRCCEAQARHNESLRAENAREEWQLFQDVMKEDPPLPQPAQPSINVDI